MTPNNKTFCLLPWNHVSVNADGTIRTCTFSTRTILKPNGEKFKFGVDHLNDIINSDDLKDIRRKMINGEEVPGCERCYAHERNGSESHRTLWHEYFPSIQNPTEIQNVEEIIYFDIKFGNLCNLKCRMCSPLLSSEFNKEAKEIQLYSNKIIELGINTVDEDMNSWYNTEEFNESIAIIAPYLRHIYITGGEPTVIKKYYWFLEYLVDKGYSKNITIRTSTNLTNVSTNMLNLLMNFNEIIYGISMDGVGKVNDYIRAPSNWSALDKNLRRIIDTDLPNKSILTTIAMSPLNLETLPDLFKYLNSFNHEASKGIVHIMPAVVDQANYYDIGNLPKDFKMQCWDKIDSWMQSEKVYFSRRFFDGMHRLKNRCMQDTLNLKSLTDFNDHTNLLDNHRGVKLEDIAPELCKVLVDLKIREPSN